MLAVLLVGVAVCGVISFRRYDVMPLTTFFVWLLLGMLTLRFRPLVVLCAAIALIGGAALVSEGPVVGVRVGVVITMVISMVLVLYQSSRQRSGLPTTLGDGLLADLRDRLQAQGKVPALPAGWASQSAMVSAHGTAYAGDFLVADLSEDGRHLEMVLVDVCGKGVGAATLALQFAGALGGLIGALPPVALFDAANDFLLRQHVDDSFATAVHVVVNLETGRYCIVSAGHPPALRWSPAEQEWVVDNARGTALGIDRRPDLVDSEGVLEPGGALLFYTDGVVESRTADIDDGIDWLRRTARSAVTGPSAFAGAARRIISQVDTGADDRAVLILSRDPA